MRYSPESQRKKIAQGVTYASLAIASILSGCKPGLEIHSLPGKPKVTLSPRVECSKGEPKNISIKFEADSSVNPLLVRIYDPDTRVGSIQEAYPTTSPHRGTFNFRGFERIRNGVKEVIDFRNGANVDVSAIESSLYTDNSGRQVVAIRPLISSTRLVLSC